MNRLWILLVALSCLMGTACDEDTQGAADTAPMEDVTTDEGADAVDSSPEDLATGDTGQPDTRLSCDTWPAPRVAGTTETDALAAIPAVCGMEAYTWLTESSLGDITELGSSETFLAAILQAGVASQGIDIGRPLSYDVQVRPYRYQTQARGVLTEASSLIAYPANWDGGALDVLLFLHGTTGFNDACAPSRSGDAKLFVAAMASLGYVVVAPDFIGLKASGDPTGYLHPYIVGEPTAHASIDAVRAAGKIARDDLGDLCLNPDYTIFGVSQGGHAALWVDRLHPYYASELELSGVVAAVPPADVLGQMERALATFVNATSNAVAVFATAADWYGTRDRVTEFFTETAAPVVLQALEDPNCDFDSVQDSFTTLESLFQQSIIDAATAGTLASVDPWGCYARESGLVTTTIPRINADSESYGVLFVLGEQDALVHTPLEREAFHTLCSQGMPLSYLECKGAEHVDAVAWSLPETFDFIEARMAGEAFAGSTTCDAELPVECSNTPAP